MMIHLHLRNPFLLPFMLIYVIWILLDRAPYNGKSRLIPLLRSLFAWSYLFDYFDYELIKTKGTVVTVVVSDLVGFGEQVLRTPPLGRSIII